MSEILVKFDVPIVDPSGAKYYAEAIGRKREDGLWEGWLEFLRLDQNGELLRSPRETTQPNRTDLDYWAQGLSLVYLSGALVRAQRSSPQIQREGEAFER